MKALIHTNPKTNKTRWCVADVNCDLTVEQYINVVDLGFRNCETHHPENFKWVEQPEGVTFQTHNYENGKFVEKPVEDIPEPTTQELPDNPT